MPLHSWKPPSGFRASTPLARGCPPHVSGSKNRKFMIQHNNNKTSDFQGRSFINSPRKTGFFLWLLSSGLSCSIWKWQPFLYLVLGKKFPSVLPTKIPKTQQNFPRLLEDRGGVGRLLSEVEAEPRQPCGHPVSSKLERAAQRTPEMSEIIKITIFAKRRQKLGN